MTPLEEYREVKGWIAAHRRDPFLWLVLLLPLVFAGGAAVSNMVLPAVFSYKDALSTIINLRNLGLVGVVINGSKLPCEAHGMKIYGYSISANIDQVGQNSSGGRICWDIFKSRWEWEFNNPRFVRFNSDKNRLPDYERE